MTRKKLATKSIVPVDGKARGNNPAHVAQTARDKSSSRPKGRAPKRTTHRKAGSTIELTCATEVRAALLHSAHVGLVPNRFMTINLEAAGIAKPVAAIGRLMKLMRDAARSRGHTLSYIWVREVGEIVGEHVHILVHVPPELKVWFARRKPGWLKRIGAGRGRGISKTRVIHGATASAGVTVSSPELFHVNLQNVTAYALKHCSTDVQRHLGIISNGPCLLTGKRISISENLHRAARSRCSCCTS